MKSVVKIICIWIHVHKIETDLINVFDTIVSRMKPGSKLIYNAYPHLATDKQDVESVLLRELVTIATEKMAKAIDCVNSILG